MINLKYTTLSLIFLITSCRVWGAGDSLLRKKILVFRHELSVGRGRSSTDEQLDGNRSKGASTNSYGLDHNSGTFCITYRYYATPMLAIGVAIAYEDDRGPWAFVNGDMQTTASGSYKRRVFTAAPEITYMYTRPGRTIRAYGALGFGGSYQNEIIAYDPQYYYAQYHNGINRLGELKEKDQSRTHLNIQLCPIGLKVGSRINVFTEMAFGYKGFLSVGLSMGFGKSIITDEYQN